MACQRALTCTHIHHCKVSIIGGPTLYIAAAPEVVMWSPPARQGTYLHKVSAETPQAFAIAQTSVISEQETAGGCRLLLPALGHHLGPNRLPQLLAASFGAVKMPETLIHPTRWTANCGVRPWRVELHSKTRQLPSCSVRSLDGYIQSAHHFSYDKPGTGT